MHVGFICYAAQYRNLGRGTRVGIGEQGRHRLAVGVDAHEVADEGAHGNCGDGHGAVLLRQLCQCLIDTGENCAAAACPGQPRPLPSSVAGSE